MKEKSLKNWIFAWMLFAKVSIILLVFFHVDTFGLEKETVFTTLAVILPLVMVYMTAIIRDVFANPYMPEKDKEGEDEKEVKKKPPRRVKRPIVILTFVAFPLYIVAIVVLISLAAADDTFETNLPNYVAGVESLFGLYIGEIVFTLFGKKEEK